jgi:hypothetical protein
MQLLLFLFLSGLPLPCHYYIRHPPIPPSSNSRNLKPDTPVVASAVSAKTQRERHRPNERESPLDQAPPACLKLPRLLGVFTSECRAGNLPAYSRPSLRPGILSRPTKDVSIIDDPSLLGGLTGLKRPVRRYGLKAELQTPASCRNPLVVRPLGRKYQHVSSLNNPDFGELSRAGAKVVRN